MDLLLLRHGRAEEAGFREDAERALTAEGAARVSQAAGGMKVLGLTPRIFTSPLLRARQTAECVARVLTPGVPPEVVALLAPGFDCDEFLAFLNVESPAALLAVGHQPDLSALASWLVGAPRPVLEMAPGTVCHLVFGSRVSPGRGVLRALLPEEILMRDGKLGSL